MYATKGSRVLLRAAQACIVQKARYITPLLAAVRTQNAIAVKELLAQGHNNIGIIDPDTGYSLAYTAIKNYDISILNILYKYEVRLLPKERSKCPGWENTYPDLFREEAQLLLAPDFAPY